MAVVKKDIHHPAAYFRKRLEVGQTIFEALRVFQVTQLADGSADQAATMLARAAQAVGVSIGEPYPDAEAAAFGCVVRDIKPVPIPEDNQSALVLVSYWTVIPQFTGGIGIISVDRDTSLVQEPTQIHPADNSQITVQPPSNIKAAPVPVTFRDTIQARRLVITAAVTQQYMDGFEDAVGSINSDTWFRKAAGYWRFEKLRDQQTLGSGTITVVAECLTYGNRPFLQYEVAKSEAFGTPLKVDPKILAQVMAIPYFYGWKSFAGITVAGLKPARSFGQLFGISKWPQ